MMIKKMRKKMQHIALHTVLIFFLFLIACGSNKEPVPQKVIIQVGEEKLTIEQLKQDIPLSPENKMTREQVLNYIQRWVENELIAKEAYNIGLDRNPEVEKVLQKAEKEYLVNKLLDSLVTDNIYIPEQDLINYYEREKDSYIRGHQEIRAMSILVADLNEANAIRARLLRKEDFETVAKEVSLDYEKKKRIDLGYFSPEDVVPEVARRVFSWKVGSITKPIRSEFGYHIFKIMDRKLANSVREFDEVKEDICKILIAEKKREIYQRYITNLKSKVTIKSNYNVLNELFQNNHQGYNQHIAIAADTLLKME
jgi:peptidyl-prolyl cis-trans isomerase C